MRPATTVPWLIAILAAAAAAMAQAADPVSPAADDVLYFGGDILTMEGNEPAYVQAVVQVGDRIGFVGRKADAVKRFPGARQVDLRGRTMLPGMIETHVHWGQFVLLSALDRVNPAEVHDVDAYLDHLRKVAASTPEGRWIISYGYEKLMIRPYRNLTREDLDGVSTRHPVFVVYNNIHWATANSAALEKLGISRESPAQLAGGGVIFKDERGVPTGLLTESAVYLIGPVISGQVSAERQATLPLEAGGQLSAYGLTTVTDLGSGGTGGLNEILALQRLAHDDRFPLRLVATPMYQVLSQMPAPIAWDGRFQATRCKLLLDASLAGGTAATTEPQLNGSTGNLNYSPEQYQGAIQACMDKGFSVATHAMGDRAHKVMLQAFENVSGKYDYGRFHNSIEHSAVIDPADLPRVRKLNMSVGLLSPFLHAYGDPLSDMVLGEPTASRLFAAVEYDRLGINTAHHSDGPICDARPLYLVWSAVNRTAVSGRVLGPALRQTPYAALLGVTRNAARHLGLENEIGTLGVGKLADFTVLAENPIKVEPMKIRDVAVLETIKGGKVYFARK